MPACDLRAAASATLWFSRDPVGGRPHLSKYLSLDSPAVALDAVHVRDLGLREADDPDIFDKARKVRVTVHRDHPFRDRDHRFRHRDHGAFRDRDQ